MCARPTFSCVCVALALALCLAGGRARGSPGYEVYSVQPGETLAGIAQKFGVSESAIAEFNGLPRGAQLEPGQSLSVPIATAAKTNGAAQDRFAAEEKAAPDVAATELSIQPASQARSGPVVGYLGVATEDTAALIDPRGRERVCAVPRGTNLCVSCRYLQHYGILMADGALAWVPQKAVVVHQVELVAGVEVPAGSNGRADLLQAAFRYWGLPYRYGGAPPGPTDCSALVQAVFRDCGLRLPRTAAEQFNCGSAVPPDQLAIGDRLYFVSGDGSIGHTGIYIGNGQFIHASSRRGCVGIDSLRSGFYRRRFAGARRP